MKVDDLCQGGLLGGQRGAGVPQEVGDTDDGPPAGGQQAAPPRSLPKRRVRVGCEVVWPIHLSDSRQTLNVATPEQAGYHSSCYWVLPGAGHSADVAPPLQCAPVAVQCQSRTVHPLLRAPRHACDKDGNVICCL